MNLLNKSLIDSGPVAKAEDGQGADIRFKAAGIGNLDRHQDVICPGAFKADVLAKFLVEGTILFNHDYRTEPIAMPVAAYEEGKFLIVEADWHSTTFAAQKKIIAQERMEKGLQVGSSIGLWPTYKYFDNGTDLLAWATGMGYDMNLFDVPTISAYEDWCWAIPEVKILLENSLLGVLPANPAAEVDALKGFTPDGEEQLTAIAKKLEFLQGRKPCEDEKTAKGIEPAQGACLRVVDARIRLAQARNARI